MNEDDMSVRAEWNALLKKDSLSEYIMESLKIRPEECKITKVNGKTKFGVQRTSIERSITNNAKPDKYGLTYLSMRAIHYWRTLYEKRMNDTNINTQEKISRAMHDDICGSLYAEIRELNEIMEGKGVVDKDLYHKVCDERDEYKSQLNKINNEYNDTLSKAIENEKKYANQEVIRLEKQIKFLEEELRKAYAKNSANKN